VPDDPNELVRTLDAPCANECEAQFLPQPIDAAKPGVHERVHASGADAKRTKLVLDVASDRRGQLVEAQHADQPRVAEPLRVVRYADGVAQDGHIGPHRRTVTALDL